MRALLEQVALMQVLPVPQLHKLFHIPYSCIMNLATSEKECKKASQLINVLHCCFLALVLLIQSDPRDDYCQHPHVVTWP
jgi:hypothetical protein